MDPRLTSAARLQQQKNYPAAERIYRQILLTEPKNVDALLLLGLLLNETSRNEESVEALRRAVKIQPHRAEVRQTMVSPLLALGRLHEAIAEARELVRLRPMVADTHQAAASLLLKANDAPAALPYAKRATELQPGSAPMSVLLGRVYQQLNLTTEAIAAADRALKIDPGYADALIDKAILRQAQGQLDEAIALYESALKTAPKNVAALNNLGSCYLMKLRCQEAIGCFEAAVALIPNSPKPRSNLGAVLKELGRIDEAIRHFQKAVELDPTYADAHCNIGASYAAVGEPTLAIAAFREALRVKPDFADVRSNLLLSLLSPPERSPAEVFAEHVAWDRQHAIGLTGPSIAARMPTDRRIRIGYVSADFREHSVRYFIEPIFTAHDRSKFEIICYASGRRRDEITDRLSKLVDAWHFVAELTNDQLADLIRSNGIDILIDLAGHTSDHRLATFARKPAPVQVTYLGYPTTTGLSAIDYRLSDSICDPPGAESYYTEKLVRLPRAFFVYSDDPAAWFDPTLPADRNGFFTFGSFNSFTKINDKTLTAWANILAAVPNSRLLMKARPLDNPSTRQRVISFFAARGVHANRLDLHPWVALEEHTKMLGSAIDLMLDTFPYNGHTTSCQSIWRGVPMVTLSGDTFRSRVGECILRNLDLPDLIGSSWQEYEQIAIRLATDLSRLRALRPTLQQRMKNSPLCDAAAFARSLENAYRQMLQGNAGDPQSADSWVDLGLSLHQNGDLTDALRAYEKAIDIEPNHAGALNNIGACYLLQGRFEDAIPVLRRAAELNPSEPRSRNNLGTAMEDLCRFDEAIEQYRAAIAIDPTFLDAINNLAGALAAICEHDKAVEQYRKALQISPDFSIAHSNLLLSMIQQSDLSEQSIFEEHKAWDRQHARPLARDRIVPQVDFTANRRLRIGYVSPDFREHSVRYFFEPILKAHDRSRVEVFCYAASNRQDAATKRLQTLADTWRHAGGLNDRQLAEQVREDRIDVLVDLAGHTSEHRLLAFAYSPAVVQMTYLGYPATTGMQSMNFRLTDSVGDPVGTESFCAETLLRLPRAFFVFDGDSSLPFDSELPAHRNGFVTFGSINNFAKISPVVLECWARILLGVPGSRLLLIAKAMNNRRTLETVRQFFTDHGVNADRLDLLPFQGVSEYYRHLSSMDLTLDPFPFNGHTTTCQSLWMGVPVVTLAGNVFRSRMGKILLSQLDLADFIADSKDQYIARAIALATNLSRLAEVRKQLRDRIRESGFCDVDGFTRSLEQIYREAFIARSPAALLARALELHQKEDHEAAIDLYEAGIALDPSNAGALNNMGACYLALRRTDEGIQCLERAALLCPTEAKTLNNIATVLEEQGKMGPAIDKYRAAVAIDPNYWEALINLAGAYHNQLMYDASIATFLEGLRLLAADSRFVAGDPETLKLKAVAHNGLAVAYQGIGKIDLAIANHREALRFNPEHDHAHNDILMAMLQAEHFSEEQVFAEHLRWAQTGSPLLQPNRSFDSIEFTPDRRLRVGYISPDFRAHPVPIFFEPIITAHDRSAFEIFCYASVGKPDEITQRIRTLSDHWRDTSRSDDAKLAEMVIADRIDILVDLAGHTGGQRLSVFARSPAPIQVTYLGYVGTTGLSAIQYRLTDSMTDPPGRESLASEKLYRLPDAFFTYGYDSSVPFTPTLPADRNGYFTFGSFNNFSKIGPTTLELWARIMRETPGSRFLFNSQPMNNPSTRKQVFDFFTAAGVSRDRLDLKPWVNNPEHYQVMAGVDLLLDTFPYNGHTTTCQAMWMGVPAVTRTGTSFRSRMGASVLHHLSLDDFITDSVDAYAAKAILLATDWTRLRELRPTLRERIKRSVLGDGPSFTRAIEAAFRTMWHDECNRRASSH